MVTSYSTIWRWHFYAGMFVMPFILILSVTGSIYLFKPQIDRWEERSFRGFGAAGTVSSNVRLATVLAANPGARLNHYRLPEHPGDAAMIQIERPDGSQRNIYVSPQGRLLGAMDPAKRFSQIVSGIHGSLLLGTWGDRLVELAASWTIVAILTGLYLWWPRPFAWRGTLWPRLSLRGRPLLKDIHRVSGFWISGLALAMLVSGLPWAGFWGSSLRWARTELGLVHGPQNWKMGAEHHHSAMSSPRPVDRAKGPPLSFFVGKAVAENMAFPVLVLPPHAPQRFGPPTGNVWTVKSEAQNRLLDRQVSYDPVSGREVSRSGFADQHPIDRIVNTSVAWHEGQLFGPANQLLNLAIAAVLITFPVIGALMWLRRRPQGAFAVPPKAGGSCPAGLMAAIVLLGLLLPLFGLSCIALFLFDRLMLWIYRIVRPLHRGGA